MGEDGDFAPAALPIFATFDRKVARLLSARSIATITTRNKRGGGARQHGADAGNDVVPHDGRVYLFLPANVAGVRVQIHAVFSLQASVQVLHSDGA